MIRCNEAVGRPILSRSSAEALGELRGFVIDPRERRVIRLVVHRGRTDELVAWEDISGFGPDAVLVSSSGALRAAESDDDKADVARRRDPLAKQLLNDQGNGAGKVRDATFDEETGALQSVSGDSAEVDASRIRGIGSYAVVVAASDEARAELA
jgi:uncharacterized protein YrrD